MMYMSKNITFQEIVKGGEDRSNWSINIYPFGYISPYVSYFFARFLPFTPNQISFLWGIIGLIGIFVMSLGGYRYLLAGILIYHLAILLDYVDGQIARATKNTTIGGSYLDTFFSWINRSLLLLALGVGLYRTDGNIIYFYLGLIAGFFFFLDNFAKLKVYECFINEKRYDLIKKRVGEVYESGKRISRGGITSKIKVFTAEMLRPFAPFSLLFFSILFDVSQYYLILMAIIIPIFFIKNFIEIYQKIGNIPTYKYLNIFFLFAPWWF